MNIETGKRTVLRNQPPPGRCPTRKSVTDEIGTGIAIEHPYGIIEGAGP